MKKYAPDPFNMKEISHNDIYYYLIKNKVSFIVNGQNFWISSKVNFKKLEYLIKLVKSAQYKMRFAKNRLHIYQK